MVNVNYPARSAAVITEAYFRTPSTTDFNGVWKENILILKRRKRKARLLFPLQNIHEHQVDHMKSVQNKAGIVFFIIKFTVLDRYFIIPYDSFEKYWERMKTGGRKSITLSEFEESSNGSDTRIQSKARLFTSGVHHYRSSAEETIER